MSGPIKTTDITGKPFWAIQEAFGKPITAYQMAAMLNAAIKHGIVSLPTPPCKHWWDYDEGFWASECDEQIDTGEGESPSKYCMSCGGKVEIVKAPEKEGGAE